MKSVSHNDLAAIGVVPTFLFRRHGATVFTMNLTHNFRTDIALARYSTCRELWDTPLFESKSFVALPTVGSFIEGWLLVVPRERTLSFAQLPDRLWNEANDFLAEVAERVERDFGKVAVFEHGPGVAQSPVGCGVDYAHFHIVPTKENLRESARRFFPAVEWKSYATLSSVQEFRSNCDGYWALLQTEYSADCWIGATSDSSPTNQLFRRLLARSMNLSDSSFDWRNNLGGELISATIEKLTCRSYA